MRLFGWSGLGFLLNMFGKIIWKGCQDCTWSISGMVNEDQPPLCPVEQKRIPILILTEENSPASVCLSRPFPQGFGLPGLICSNPTTAQRQNPAAFSPANPIFASQRHFSDGLGSAGLVWSSGKEENGAKAWEWPGKASLEKKPSGNGM